MLWVKSFHIVFVVAWFAGLFYLPRLFVYHALADDTASRERFKVMERKLYRGIMMPTMVLTLATGLWMRTARSTRSLRAYVRAQSNIVGMM